MSPTKILKKETKGERSMYIQEVSNTSNMYM